MGLAQYCAYFFVARRLGTFADRTPAVDTGLADGTDRVQLAASLADAVDSASLTSHPRIVRADANALGQASSNWQRAFEVRDSLLACCFFDPGEPPDVKVVHAAFSDYIVTRWIFKEVFKFDIRRRPLDRAFPPPFDEDAKMGLAESLVRIVESVGLAVGDRDTFVEGASDWDLLSEARAALMKQVAS